MMPNPQDILNITLRSGDKVSFNLTNKLPRCAICNKLVDGVKWEFNPLKCVTLFVAMCHGDMEYTELSDLEIRDADSIMFGVAFNKKQGEIKRLEEN